ncbi:increased loss of mitochondrial DNA protein 1 [Xylariomycetidae sp. FL0641]|nr:increased loss of mitochondrial DNA protein 1 [Xylariomycetidae sp. FL0641]
MALISASTILTSMCLFHLTMAFFFFAKPSAIADQDLVWLLGQALGMPETNHFATPTPVSALLAVVLLLVGLSDLLTLSMPEEIWLVHYWGAQAPCRCLLFGALAGFAYFSAPTAASSSRLALSRPQVPHHLDRAAFGTASGPDGLRNRVFLAFALLETVAWFWAWVTLKEEARALAGRKRRRSSSGSAGRLR